MNNQDKISWYLSKGFAVEVKADDHHLSEGYQKTIIYFCDKERFYGLNGFGGFDPFAFDSTYIGKIKSITPIPPKPYEFKVGERVMITDGCNDGKIGIIEKQKEDYYSVKIDGQLLAYWPRTLAPALPEDDDCEVVEVVETDVYMCQGYEMNFTKPDGKKLKIKVIKK